MNKIKKISKISKISKKINLILIIISLLISINIGYSKVAVQEVKIQNLNKISNIQNENFFEYKTEIDTKDCFYIYNSEKLLFKAPESFNPEIKMYSPEVRIKLYNNQENKDFYFLIDPNRNNFCIQNFTVYFGNIKTDRSNTLNVSEIEFKKIQEYLELFGNKNAKNFSVDDIKKRSEFILNENLQINISKNELYIEDIDKDMINNYEDNCIEIYNPNQEDENSNNIGDFCEDTDKDYILNYIDNCPEIDNILQEDFDKDGIGNACDEKDDRYIESNIIQFYIIISISIIIFIYLCIIISKEKKNE